MKAAVRCLTLACLLAASVTVTSSVPCGAGHLPSLQHAFDKWYGAECVDTHLETGAQSFSAGTYNFAVIARNKAFGNRFGWYPVGHPNERHEIFASATDPAGSIKTVTVPVEFGLWLSVFDGPPVWFTDPTLNSDELDHFLSFAVCSESGGGVAFGIEDVAGLGDQDYDDVIVGFAPLGEKIFELRRPPIPLSAGRTMEPLGPGGAKGIRGNVQFPSEMTLGKDPLVVEVIRHPCPDEPVVSVDGFQYFIRWETECVFPGDQVVIYAGGPDQAPISADGVWEDAGGDLPDPVVVVEVPCAANQAPAFALPDPCGATRTVSVGTEIRFDVRAADADPGDDVALGVIGLPAGASFLPAPAPPGNPVTREFRWTPGAADLGDHVVTFTASDRCRESALCRQTIRVVGNRRPDCSGARPDRTHLWPPNHKLVPVQILGVTDPDGDPVTIEVTGVTHDEPGRGRGPRRCDAIIEGGTVLLRAERHGNGNGRVYQVGFTARDGRGGECSGVVTVCVPHDQWVGRLCVDDGQVVDAVCRSGAATAEPDVEDPAAGPPPIADLQVRAVQERLVNLEFSLPEDAEIVLGVYDVAGRRLARLASGRHAAGSHALTWNASGVTPGMYFVRFTAGERSVTRTVRLLP